MDPAALQPGVAIIPLIKGVNTKTDVEVLQPPELVLLENASFFAPGAIQKDPGYALLSSSTLTGSVALNTPIRRLIDVGTSQLIADREGVLERAEIADRFRKLPGFQASLGINPFATMAVEQIDDLAVSQTASAGTCNYTAVTVGSSVYELMIGKATVGLQIAIREQATGTILFTSAQVGDGASISCSVVGTRLAAFWVNGTAIQGLVWDASTPTVAPTVNTGLNAAANTAGSVMDVAAGASHYYITYITTVPGLAVRKILASSFASVALGTLAGAGVTNVSICLDASENVLVAYRDGGGCKMAGFTTALAARSNSTISAAGIAHVAGVSCENASLEGMVFYTTANGLNRSRVLFDGSGGAIVTATLFDSPVLLSKPFLIDTLIFIAVQWTRTDANGNVEQVAYVVAHGAISGDSTTLEPVAWYLYNRQSNGAQLLQGHQVTAVIGPFWTEYRFFHTILNQTSVADTYASVSLQRFRPWEGQAVALPLKGGAAMVANSFVSSGAGLIEASLGYAPVITSISQSATGSLVVGQTYTWQVVYEVLFPDGTIVRSPASVPVSATITVGNGQATVNFSAPLSRSGAVVTSRVFRSQAGPGATRTLLTVTSTVDRRTAALTSVTDGASDASIAANRLVYTTGGVLDAQPAPPHRAITVHQNRLFAIIEETRELRYTRDIVDGEAPAWHANLAVNVIGQGIVPYALVSTSNGLWVLGRDARSGAGAIALLVGDGPDDTGASSTYTLQRLETADTGPADWRHAVSTPAGVVFEDPWRGYHLLPPGGGTPVFIGAPIESSRLQNGAIGGSTALTCMLKRNEVRICNVDRIFVWHYDVGNWSQRFIAGGPTIGDAGMWNGDHVLRTSAGILRQGSTFRDNSTFYALRLKTAWIRMSDIAGLQKVWEIFICGKFKSAHGLTVNLYYDGGSTPDTYTFTSADETANSADLKLRIRPRIRKMERLMVEILDTDAGSGTREGAQWNALRIHYGALRRGTKSRTTALKG